MTNQGTLYAEGRPSRSYITTNYVNCPHADRGDYTNMLFGHQSDANQPVPDQGGVNPLAVDPASGVSLPVAPADQWQQPQPTQFGPPMPAQPPVGLAPGPVAPVVPDSSYGTSPGYGTPAPAQTYTPQPEAPAPLSPAPVDATSDATPATGDDALLGLKQQALEQLSPLVSHLEQSPEEKFRTTMMMIQSSDNQSLIKDAYEAAQAISDDKVRAQALLDIVNEINYFTQHTEN